MRSQLTHKTIPWALAAALLLAAGCGDDDSRESRKGDNTAPAEADPSGSAYCDAVIEWAIYEMVPVDDTDPVAFEAYWEIWTAFEEEAVATAPEELHADWKLKYESEKETLTPVLEKYDFDVATLMENATPEEQSATEAPPDVQAAQDRILAYETEVCGAYQPAAVDVAYAGEEPGPYCGLVAGNDKEAADVLAGGADPAAVEDLFAAQSERLDALVDAAPEVIHEDVVMLKEWTLGPQIDALEAHDFDVKVLLREGSAQERYDFNYADAHIREQFGRVLAYEEQVCGA